MKLGTAHPMYRPLIAILSLFPEWSRLSDAKLGIEVEARAIKPRHTDEQLRGYWLLINDWLKQATAKGQLRGVDPETLHKWVSSTHFGRIERELPDGTIDYIPLRTITSAWDEDIPGYRKKRLTVEQFTDLIEFVYRTAAEGGIVLPELETA